jgi:hypothetical protein
MMGNFYRSSRIVVTELLGVLLDVQRDPLVVPVWRGIVWR